MKELTIAVMSAAAGAVGQEILKVMAERKIVIRRTASFWPVPGRLLRTRITYQGKTYTLQETTENSFDDVDLALFPRDPASRAFGRLAQSKGCVVIDNSSTFRFEPDVPLVVPEVNPEALKDHKGLIANPNCSTIILLVSAPYLQAAQKEQSKTSYCVHFTRRYPALAKEAIDELTLQVKQTLNGEAIEPHIFQHQIAFNLIPHIDVWVEDDYTKEEMKLVYETQKILSDDSISIFSNPRFEYRCIAAVPNRYM